MIPLPWAERAVVAEAKVRDYLLQPDHPQNRGKAGLFTAHGYHLGNWTILRRALILHGQTRPVVRVTQSAHGQKFVVQCSLVTPDERNPCVTSIWIMDRNGDTPRLITCYGSAGEIHPSVVEE